MIGRRSEHNLRTEEINMATMKSEVFYGECLFPSDKIEM
jgi:hypothetical protein